jgi:septum formation protein
MKKKIILASQSPRRKWLLEQVGLEFDIIPSSFEENIEGEKFTPKLIESLAYNKALEVSERTEQEALIIGADTVVILNNQILGKPKDEKEAAQMLQKLSNNTHKVITAVAVIDKYEDKTIINHTISKVTFKKLSEREIQDYIKTGEPMDKAGAYGIQAYGSIFVTKVEGCYNNIVGLPLNLLSEMLKSVGVYLI